MQKKSILGVVAVSTLALCFTACDWFGRVEEQDHTNMEFCTAVFEDSAAVLESNAYQSLSVDFPVEEEDTSSLAQNLLSWLCEKVSKCSFPDWSGEWPGKDLSLEAVTPTLSQNDGLFAESLVTFYGQKGLEKMKEAIGEEAADGFLGSYMNNLQIQMIEQTDGYLTFTLMHDVYLGGAHGSCMVEGITFRKSDGKQLSWQMFDKDKRAEMIEKLKPGLKEYFGNSDEGSLKSDEELFDCLMLFDDPDTPENELEYGLPLPRTEPWLTRDGIIFMYQQYEIAAYAYGMPDCIIPAEEIIPLLTDDGKAWLTSVLQ